MIDNVESNSRATIYMVPNEHVNTMTKWVKKVRGAKWGKAKSEYKVTVNQVQL